MRLQTLLVGPLCDLVLPRSCVGCGRSGVALCPGCLPDRGPPSPHVLSDLPVTAAAAYDGAVRAALLRYKERGRRDLAGVLGQLLAGSLADLLRTVGPGPDVRVLLVAVPSSRSAARARGGRPLDRLAALAAATTGHRVARGALRITRSVRDSAGLDHAERARNLAGALQARAAPPATAAVLLDDIVTTGATLRESTRALRSAGWPVLGAAVVAATARDTPRSFSAHPLAGHSPPV